MLGFIDSRLCAWHLWVGLLAVVALDLAMMLVTVPRLAEFSSGGLMFDLRISGYSPRRAAAYIADLGEAGRTYYASVHVPVDTVFAVIEAIVLALIILWFTRPGARFSVALPPLWRWVAVALPVSAGVFDIRENLLVSEMLAASPQLDPGLVRAASFATQMKWGLAFISIALAFGLACAAWIRGRNKSPRTPVRH
jgi:hypothetical protein